MHPTGPSEAPDRRVTWADRENARRREAYEAARERWRDLEDALRGMVATASGARTVQPDDPPSVTLRSGEIILWSSPDVRLVEPKANLPLGEVGYQAFDLRTVRVERYAPGAPARDEGSAIVTNQRVIFRGGHSGREWAYARLTGLTHETSRSATLMRIDDRRWASGLMVRDGEVPGFRFAVTLGIADHLGHRPDLVSHLETMLAEHLAGEPVAPPPVRPEDAPAGPLPALREALREALPRVGPRALLATGAGTLSLALVIALFGLLGIFSSGETPSRGETGAGGALAPDLGMYGATGTPGGRTLLPPPSTARTATPTPTPSPTRSKRKAKAPSLCGAPANPYGYNYCGGSIVTSPGANTCDYFDCRSLDGGKGYLVRCADGQLSLTGGRPNACAAHDGVANTVYR